MGRRCLPAWAPGAAVAEGQCDQSHSALGSSHCSGSSFWRFWGGLGVLQLTSLQQPLWANSDCFICPGEDLQSGLCFILIYKSSLKGTIFSTAFTKPCRGWAVLWEQEGAGVGPPSENHLCVVLQKLRWGFQRQKCDKVLAVLPCLCKSGFCCFFKSWNKHLQKYLTVRQLTLQLSTSVPWCAFPAL